MEIITLNKMGVNKEGADEMGVDVIGSRGNGNKPFIIYIFYYLNNIKTTVCEVNCLTSSNQRTNGPVNAHMTIGLTHKEQF